MSQSSKKAVLQSSLFTSLIYPILPQSTLQLFQLFFSPSPLQLRILALSKIKMQMTSSYHQQQQYDHQIGDKVQRMINGVIIRYIEREKVYDDGGRNMFVHVVAMAVKYYYSENGFRKMVANVTEMIDNHQECIGLVLQLFRQIIETIEQSVETNQQQMFRCHFERHLLNQHLNSMLTLANFTLENSLLPKGTSLNDAPPEETLHINTDQSTISQALALVRTCLAFDWGSEKYSQAEEQSEMGLILLPTKRTKTANQENEFDKWLRNSEWVRVYQLTFGVAKSLRLKEEVLMLLGDMSRVHMKYFKTKLNYRTHIQNIVYAYSTILASLQIYRNSQQTLKTAITLLSNMLKLTTPSVLPILYQININFFISLMGAMKKFITYQIIGQQILNGDILVFAFGFMERVWQRGKYGRNSEGYTQAIEDTLRDICRSYQQYIRLLLNRVKRSPIRSQSSSYRLDYTTLKDAISTYQLSSLSTFFLPFRMMKPRYATHNTVYQLFIYLTARVVRAHSMLISYKLQQWEQEVAYSMISQAIVKIGERYGFTTYRRRSRGEKEDNRSSVESSQEGPLPPISQHYQEEIENQEQYCHILRLAAFMIIDQLVEMSTQSLVKISAAVVKLAATTLELCLCADVETEWISIGAILQQLVGLVGRALRRQWQRVLTRYKNKGQLYHYCCNTSELQMIDLQLQGQINQLLSLIDRLPASPTPQISTTLFQLRLLCLLFLQPSINLPHFPTIQTCFFWLQLMKDDNALLLLARCRHPKLLTIMNNLLLFLHSKQAATLSFSNVSHLLRQLCILKIGQISQQAGNKLFIMWNAIARNDFNQQLQWQDLQQMQAIVHLFINSKETDLQQLAYYLKQILNRYNDKKNDNGVIIDSNSHSIFKSGSQSSQNVDLSKNSSILCNYQVHVVEEMEIQKEQAEEQEGSGKKYTQKEAQKEEINKEEEENKPEVIYSGYHRDKTINIINKYLEPTQQQDWTNQTVEAKKEEKEMTQIGDNQDRQDIADVSHGQPMEIEHPTHQTPQAPCTQPEKVPQMEQAPTISTVQSKEAPLTPPKRAKPEPLEADTPFPLIQHQLVHPSSQKSNLSRQRNKIEAALSQSHRKSKTSQQSPHLNKSAKVISNVYLEGQSRPGQDQQPEQQPHNSQQVVSQPHRSSSKSGLLLSSQSSSSPEETPKVSSQ